MCLLVAAALPGCAETAAVRPSQWVRQFRASQNLYSENVARIDVALLEASREDPFLNRELWTYADEQVVDMDRRVVIERSGLRVGQIVGMPPGKFQQLLTNERSCINARTQFVGSGQSTRCDLCSPLEEVTFVVHTGGERSNLKFEDAKIQLDVTATLAPQGRTRLRFVPRVEHGEPIQQIRPASDRNGLSLQVERPSKTFPELAWELTIAPNEFLVIGTNQEQPGTLGHRAFISEEKSRSIQRVLVLRTARTPSSADEPENASLEDLSRASAAMPLALQATLTSARGSRP